jgi:PASTA domain
LIRATRTLVVATLVLSACAGSDSSDSLDTSAPASTPVTAASVVSTAPPATEPPAIDAPTTTADDGANPFGGNDPEDGLMPSVVCMNLQDAQDEIQDHGVFASGSEDATGQGRSQIIDSNWQVVDQDPAPGTAIGEFDATLFVVKYGEEPNPC